MRKRIIKTAAAITSFKGLKKTWQLQREQERDQH